MINWNVYEMIQLKLYWGKKNAYNINKLMNEFSIHLMDFRVLLQIASHHQWNYLNYKLNERNTAHDTTDDWNVIFLA